MGLTECRECNMNPLEGRSSNNLKESTSIDIVNRVPVVRNEFNWAKQSTYNRIDEKATFFQWSIDTYFVPLISRIIAYNQGHLFEAFKSIQPESRQQFLAQIQVKVNFEIMDTLYQNAIRKGKKLVYTTAAKAVKVSEKEDRRRLRKEGIELLRSHKVGIVIMCAGSSSQFNGLDKFLVNLPMGEHTCLLAILFQRLRYYMQPPKDKVASIPIIISCNDENRHRIEKYIKGENYFGFNRKQIKFIETKNLPILSKEGRVCLTSEKRVITRPAGTAQVLDEMVKSNIINSFESAGIEYLHFLGGDNVAEVPGDPLLLGLISQLNNKVCAKCTDAKPFERHFHRYADERGKVVLADSDSVREKEPDSNLFKIAMNSLVLRVSVLRQVIYELEHASVESNVYRPMLRKEGYYDFQNETPISDNCYVFEKDICNVLSCVKDPVLLRVPRQQYIPIVSDCKEYSIYEACQAYKLSVSSKQETRNSISESLISK